MSVDPGPEQLRSEVATAHGLDAAAASFLTGSTLSDVETSASHLAKLLDVGDDVREPEPTAGVDPFAEALAAKARRKAEVAAIVTGRAPTRDESGRFASRAGSGGFDGGARRPLPAPPPSHDQWLAGVLASRAADRGAWF